VKLARVGIFSRRTPAKVGSNTIFRIMAMVTLWTSQPHFITMPGHPLQVCKNCMQKGFVSCITRTRRFTTNCLQYRWKKKTRVCNGLLFLGNLDPSLTPGGPVALLVCGFLLAWHELFANLYELTSRILVLGGIQPLWANMKGIWIWPIFVKFRQNIRGIMTNKSVSEYFDIWNTQHDSHIFSYTNFRCRYLDN